MGGGGGGERGGRGGAEYVSIRPLLGGPQCHMSVLIKTQVAPPLDSTIFII